ncbi:hypothetical protein ACFWHR_14285 [Leucobacter sp. NPDC058333]|uniref:hypothetical protein n=1 Tax=Leucobacter sp. NPDC058333 TaxID=3346450 RepID=UPI0036477FE3
MSVSGSELPGAITWARIEDDFFVASRDGEFLGFIDVEATGGYAVCDQYSRPIGHFAELDAAMTALRDAPRTAAETAVPDTTGADQHAR